MSGITAPKTLLAVPEQFLYVRLVRAFPAHVILAQVALSRLLAGDSSTAAPGQPISNRCRHLVAGFVVCRPDFTVLAVVELDEGAGARGTLRDRLRRKDQLLQAAGVKVVRFAAADIPREPALRSLITALPMQGSAPQMRRAS